MKTNYEIRYASHSQDAKNYDTSRLRKEFLVERIHKMQKITTPHD